LESPVWAGLSMEARLSDVVIFDNDSARGRGPLAASFQQLIADEQRPIIVARPGLDIEGVVAVAWDGGKEATRAVRTAVPLLEKAARVVIISAPSSSSREFSPEALQAYLQARKVKAEILVQTGSGDAGPILLKAAKEAGANLLVAGAFGHPRLQEFIFGGTTRTLLNAEVDAPSLFLSH
ncbi:MAG: universal stress protein UspA, partial [Brevundimonas sp.]|nr:universal stress protein UspA [Brevundimonas sp.]